MPFIGAGASKIFEIPDWKNLVRLYNEHSNTPIDFQEEFEKDEDLPRITQLIFEKTERNFENYYTFLSDKVKPNSTKISGLSLGLTENFEQIITTNFDSVFDYVAQYEKQTKKKLIYPEIDPIDFNGPAIAYLHGKISEKQFVFKKDEYINAYKTEFPVIKDFLKSVVKRKVLLFIGFSFSDLEFKKVLSEVVTELKFNENNYEKLYGRKIKNTGVKGMYVITSDEYQDEKINGQFLIDNGVNIDDNIKSIFTVNETDGGIYLSMKEGVSQSKLESILLPTLGDKKFKEFKKIIGIAIRNKNNNEYFKNNRIKPILIPFNDSPVEVEEFIEKIVKGIEQVKENTDNASFIQ